MKTVKLSLLLFLSSRNQYVHIYIAFSNFCFLFFKIISFFFLSLTMRILFSHIFSKILLQSTRLHSSAELAISIKVGSIKKKEARSKTTWRKLLAVETFTFLFFFLGFCTPKKKKKRTSFSKMHVVLFCLSNQNPTKCISASLFIHISPLIFHWSRSSQKCQRDLLSRHIHSNQH